MAKLGALALETAITKFCRNTARGGKRVKVFDETSKLMEIAGIKKTSIASSISSYYQTKKGDVLIAGLEGKGVQVNVGLNGKNYRRAVQPSRTLDYDIRNNVKPSVDNNTFATVLYDLLA